MSVRIAVSLLLLALVVCVSSSAPAADAIQLVHDGSSISAGLVDMDLLEQLETGQVSLLETGSETLVVESVEKRRNKAKKATKKKQGKKSKKATKKKQGKKSKKATKKKQFKVDRNAWKKSKYAAKLISTLAPIKKSISKYYKKASATKKQYKATPKAKKARRNRLMSEAKGFLKIARTRVKTIQALKKQQLRELRSQLKETKKQKKVYFKRLLEAQEMKKKGKKERNFQKRKYMLTQAAGKIELNAKLRDDASAMIKKLTKYVKALKRVDVADPIGKLRRKMERLRKEKVAIRKRMRKWQKQGLAKRNLRGRVMKAWKKLHARRLRKIALRKKKGFVSGTNVRIHDKDLYTKTPGSPYWRDNYYIVGKVGNKYRVRTPKGQILKKLISVKYIREGKKKARKAKSTKSEKMRKARKAAAKAARIRRAAIQRRKIKAKKLLAAEKCSKEKHGKDYQFCVSLHKRRAMRLAKAKAKAERDDMVRLSPASVASKAMARKMQRQQAKADHIQARIEATKKALKSVDPTKPLGLLGRMTDIEYFRKLKQLSDVRVTTVRWQLARDDTANMEEKVIAGAMVSHYTKMEGIRQNRADVLHGVQRLIHHVEKTPAEILDSLKPLKIPDRLALLAEAITKSDKKMDAAEDAYDSIKKLHIRMIQADFKSKKLKAIVGALGIGAMTGDGKAKDNEAVRNYKNAKAKATALKNSYFEAENKAKKALRSAQKEVSEERKKLAKYKKVVSALLANDFERDRNLHMYFFVNQQKTMKNLKEFVTAFKADVNSLLGIREQRIVVSDVFRYHQGVKVDFTIKAPEPGVEEIGAEACMVTIREELEKKNSKFLKRPLMTKLDVKFPLEQEIGSSFTPDVWLHDPKYFVSAEYKKDAQPTLVRAIVNVPV